jgi:hypothetical protein
MLIEFHIQTAITIEPANKAASCTLINTAHQAAHLVGYQDTTVIKNSTITKSTRIRGIYAITTSILLSFSYPSNLYNSMVAIITTTTALIAELVRRPAEAFIS